jgi:proteic killer suppression protein
MRVGCRDDVAIRSFKHDLPRALLERGDVKRFPPDLRRVARRRIVAIADADRLDDLRSPPGNRLEALKGNRQGQFSIRINDQWRVCFRWGNGAAEDVEIVDYYG